ncbi:hypothetical protein [Hymenobacter sp. BT491]|nr:hypothetical protein [Hymenobacter sp. BT491]
MKNISLLIPNWSLERHDEVATRLLWVWGAVGGLGLLFALML